MSTELAVPDDLTSLLSALRARADNAYIEYVSKCRKDECLGWEIKVVRGEFGIAEMQAHCAAAEILGRHRALHEAANLIGEFLKAGK